ncbi:MAG TPA: 6-carboxytetrahydropterin synthase QueD [bacterium]|uniref:6-carboxy-5,6,7,8-tetrahydropterin synthase n=1 Tax=candidate division TA06 bacterium ADurb.Bin417 TaxID=1852828 RepID=A0A1V5M6X8_UNCT6|nr:MAG: 6-carboxy-5,6,7,8-tetrahydropterin synthase [candidate division TA06 bacterium ADurb.Bin417]HNQ34510.1 6-carboxytetrahydropterin synthase QueD [bacterium]HNS48044.1 6-carboxytetrahydropterin synthase QueD [bacterium]
MPYEIEVQDYFSAAHQLRGYRGKCEHMHGHNWKVAVALRAGQLDKTGLVLDFTILKRLLRQALKEFDHTVINDHPEFQRQNPTSENLARFLFERLQPRFKKSGLTLARVTVWESIRSRASYYE